MSSYSRPPPSYSPAKPGYEGTEETQEPLSGSRRSPSPGPSAGAIDNQPSLGDVPDDFKYRVWVNDRNLEVRNAFIRLVYFLLMTRVHSVILCGDMLSESRSTVLWVRANPWLYCVLVFGVFISLYLLHWKSRDHPLNLVLLCTSRLLESFALGTLCAYFDSTLVIEALMTTRIIFTGMIVFTFQSKYEFSGMGPWLVIGLIGLFLTGTLGIVDPSSLTVDRLCAFGGAIIFSGYTTYKIHSINARLSPHKYIKAAIDLYLLL